MTKKTKKDLETEVVQLKQLLVDSNTKLETLQMKCDSLEKKIDENIVPKKNEFKCKKCEKEFETFREMSNHVRTHKSNNDSFNCNKCDRTFDEEWKLNAHNKGYHKHSCDHCDRTFKFEELKQKHILIYHENVKLYCHFFNNCKVCPHDEECVFLHVYSAQCKYKNLCERKYCMYKHATSAADGNYDNDVIEVDTENDDDVLNNDEDGDSVRVDEKEDDTNMDGYYDQDDETDRTFYDPSQSEDSDSSTSCAKKIKCEMCDLKLKNTTDLREHKTEVHNWCYMCYSTFESQQKLTSHNNMVHSENNVALNLTMKD